MTTNTTAHKVPDPLEEPVLSVERAGELLGIGRTSAYRAARNGELGAFRVGGRWVVPTAALRRMLGIPVTDDPATSAAG